MALLETLFCPKKNVLVEQHSFLCEVQNENQSISEFVAVLQKKEELNVYLCVNVKSRWQTFFSQQLLQNPKSIFKEIVEPSD